MITRMLCMHIASEGDAGNDHVLGSPLNPLECGTKHECHTYGLHADITSSLFRGHASWRRSRQLALCFYVKHSCMSTPACFLHKHVSMCVEDSVNKLNLQRRNTRRYVCLSIHMYVSRTLPACVSCLDMIDMSCRIHRPLIRWERWNETLDVRWQPSFKPEPPTTCDTTAKCVTMIIMLSMSWHAL